MSKNIETDYKIFDLPDILVRLFHPRSDAATASSSAGIFFIPVAEEVRIGAQLHHCGFDRPTILFFHGNGEIVSDYDDIGNLYIQSGINFIAVDYRGYGKSNGSPSVSNMMRDADFIFRFVKKDLQEKGYHGPLIIMGRSLGSAPALEVAARHQDEIAAIIIESGFAYTVPLLETLGVDTRAHHLNDAAGTWNIDKIKQFGKSVLVIHAQNDHIIPVTDGKVLYEAAPSELKDLLIIPHADHNSIFYYGLNEYMQAIKKLADALV